MPRYEGMPGIKTTIVHLITGLEVGGAERMLARLVTATDRDRFTSIVVSMTDEGAVGPLLTKAGIRLETLGMRRGRADPRAVPRLLRILRAVRPDVVQTWLYHADLLGLVARWLGHAPALLWNVRCSESVGAGAVRFALARLSATPDCVIVNSLAGQRFHQGLGYHPKRWEYFPNGFDTRALRPDEAARQRFRGELGIADETIAIGLAARYHAMKDHATFLAAAALLTRSRPGIVFLLAGSGITRDNRELVAAIDAQGLGDRVRLLGEQADMSSSLSGLRHRRLIVGLRRRLSQCPRRGDGVRYPLRRHRQRRQRSDARRDRPRRAVPRSGGAGQSLGRDNRPRARRAALAGRRGTPPHRARLRPRRDHWPLRGALSRTHPTAHEARN